VSAVATDVQTETSGSFFNFRAKLPYSYTETYSTQSGRLSTRDLQVNMKPEIVVFLVANLLSFRSLALSADTAAGSSLSDERDAAADSAGVAKIPRLAGTQFEARRKRSLSADDAKYRTAGDVRRLRDQPTSGSDDKHLVEPNIAE